MADTRNPLGCAFGDAPRWMNDALAGLDQVIGAPFMVATPLSRRFAYGLQREVFDAFLARCELEFAGFRFVSGGP